MAKTYLPEVILRCHTSQLKHVSGVSSVMGQNSPTPWGDQNSQLASRGEHWGVSGKPNSLFAEGTVI